MTTATPQFVAQQFLADQQNVYAQSQGDIALGLINIYRALGGGCEIRLDKPAAPGAEGVHAPAGPDSDAETVPAPRNPPAVNATPP